MINESELIRIIEETCSNPKTYTRNGTFVEVSDFLEKSGRRAVAGTYYHHSIFTPFLKWFVIKIDKDMVINMKSFQKSFSSDDEALRSLPILYKEYVKSLR